MSKQIPELRSCDPLIHCRAITSSLPLPPTKITYHAHIPTRLPRAVSPKHHRVQSLLFRSHRRISWIFVGASSFVRLFVPVSIKASSVPAIVLLLLACLIMTAQPAHGLSLSLKYGAISPTALRFTILSRGKPLPCLRKWLWNVTPPTTNHLRTTRHAHLWES
jgi:hypothetical protein